MAKFTFDKSTKKKAPKPITETKISKPKETYNPAKMTKQVEEDYQKQPKEKRPVGRPKSGRKSYQTVRLQKKTVLKINALENALSVATQDATVAQAIERVLNSLTTDEKRSYELWLDMFEKKISK
ncbi:replication-associated protein RepC [Limosilactobacillus reuteri subsp. suis]|uniref:replication-associated protein RepC n=1 Tax=Limosilactobacillus reuteri TaxID=1598 RepID=UPI003994E572